MNLNNESFMMASEEGNADYNDNIQQGFQSTNVELEEDSLKYYNSSPVQIQLTQIEIGKNMFLQYNKVIIYFKYHYKLNKAN